MDRLPDWQEEFAAALLNPNVLSPAGVTDPLGKPSPRRFAVYRNNVAVGLVEALRDSFTVACRIVGEEFFYVMARQYALENPPHSTILLEYGAGFAGFVEGFGPASGVPYLGDVCRIERAWLEAYHEAEALPISCAALREIETAKIHRLRLRFHPSLRIVRSRFPALTIWSTNIEGSIPIPVDLKAGGENVLIARPHAEVKVRSLLRADMNFVEALSQGSTILSAAGEALIIDPKFSFFAALEGLIDMGLVIGIKANSNVVSESY